MRSLFLIKKMQIGFGGKKAIIVAINVYNRLKMTL